MRWEVHKQRCEQLDLAYRRMIEQTAEPLNADVQKRLLVEPAEKPPLPPGGRLGDARADMLVTNDLSNVERQISDSVDRAVVAGRRRSATTIHGVGRLGEIWCHCGVSVERQANV